MYNQCFEINKEAPDIMLRTGYRVYIYIYLKGGIYQIRRGVLDTTLCDKVCKWLATGRWLSSGTPASSTNKTDRHDITAILLKVTVNTTTLTLLILDYEPTWWVLSVFQRGIVRSGLEVLLVEEAGVPEESHRPVASHLQTLSHNVVSSTPLRIWYIPPLRYIYIYIYSITSSKHYVDMILNINKS
jgi:hypothetical protein